MNAVQVSEEDLSAFADGELPPARAADVASALARDTALASRLALLQHDKERLRAAFAPVAEAALPEAWLRRIEDAVERPTATVLPFIPRKTQRPAPAFSRARYGAIAAGLMLAVGLGVMQQRMAAPQDALLAQALDARGGAVATLAHADAASLPPPDIQRVMLAKATGLPVRAPDLNRLGWHLAAIDTYRDAASLRYTNAAGQKLFVFVRRSTGAPRFDILQRRQDRVCVWQDEVVAAVLIGDMSAGQMMRVAGAAYASLDM